MCGGLDGEALRDREEKRLMGRRERKEEEGVAEAAEVERSFEVEMEVEIEEIAIERERFFLSTLSSVEGDGIYSCSGATAMASAMCFSVQCSTIIHFFLKSANIL